MEDPHPTRSPTRFGLAALAWSLAFFAFLYTPWVQHRLLLPLTRLEKAVADWYCGGSPLPVAVTLTCSGADVIALCLGAILAYPVSWPSRLAGGLGGLALILTLNVGRIGALGRAVAHPHLFALLHLYAFPTVLVLATGGYVFTWMRAAENRRRAVAGETDHGLPRPIRRFVFLAGALLVAFAAFAPWTLGSHWLLGAAAWIARTAAPLLTALGVPASASGNTLVTSRGAFLVTQECVASSLIPLYLAAVLALPLSRLGRALGVLASVPLFAFLGVARLLLLALPPALIGSPLWLVHGFSQLLLALLAVAIASGWREGLTRSGWPRAARRALLASLAGLVVAALLGGAYTRGMLRVTGAIGSAAPHALARLMALEDDQGALGILPAYQAGLVVALGLAAFGAPLLRRLLSALGLLSLCLLLLLVALGELGAHADFVPHAILVRCLGVALPVLVTLLVMRAGTRPAERAGLA